MLRIFAVAVISIAAFFSCGFRYFHAPSDGEISIETICMAYAVGAGGRPVHCVPAAGCFGLPHNCGAVACTHAKEVGLAFSTCELLDNSTCIQAPAVNCVRIDHYRGGNCNGAVICSTNKTILSCTP